MKTVTVWVLLMISSQNTNGAVSFVIDNLPSLEACEKLAAEMEEKRLLSEIIDNNKDKSLI